MSPLPPLNARRGWLAAVLAAGTPDRTLDPVRIQKAMFLLSEEGPAPLKHLYEFQPYHFGPCSFDLYRDLDALEAEGVVKSDVPPGQTWKIYELTEKGQEVGRAALASAGAAERSAVQSTMDFVLTRSFRRLLKDVYAKYPEYATKSVLR